MISKSATLHCQADRAFALFTERAGEWWPVERRHTGDAESEIHILASGRFFERARDGREVELGRVKVWEPPTRVVLDWYPGTSAERPTQVTVVFEQLGDQTRIVIEHAPGASGDHWPQRSARFERSWDLVLAALVVATG